VAARTKPSKRNVPVTREKFPDPRETFSSRGKISRNRPKRFRHIGKSPRPAGGHQFGVLLALFGALLFDNDLRSRLDDDFGLALVECYFSADTNVLSV